MTTDHDDRDDGAPAKLGGANNGGENGAPAAAAPALAESIVFTIKMHQMGDGAVRWEAPVALVILQQILEKALTHIERELIADRTAQLVLKALDRPRVVLANPNASAPPRLS